MSESTERLAAVLLRTMRIVRDQWGPKQNISSFTIARLQALQYIINCEGQNNRSEKYPTMHDLARHLAITPPSATSIVNGLVKSGELKRGKDPGDRRVVRIELTRKGKAAYKRAQEKRVKLMSTALIKLNNKERKELLKILEKISTKYAK